MSLHKGGRRFRIRLKSTPGKHKMVIRSAVLAMIVATFALVTGASTTSASATDDTMTVHVKASSLSDHSDDCTETGNVSGQLNVTDPDNAVQDSIKVYTNMGTYTADEVTFKQVGNVLQIVVPLANGEFITDATIEVNAAWDGQFVLSHYTCGEKPPAEPEDLTYDTTCGQITFHNPNDFDVTLNYDADGAPGAPYELSAVVPANGSKVIETTLESFRFYAYSNDVDFEQGGTVEMPTDCGPPPTPKPGTATAASGACSKQGETTGTATVTVTNTADDTKENVTYDVTLNGVKKQVMLADGASDSVTFTGLASGDYNWSVAGPDGTEVSGKVTVKECTTPPPPPNQTCPSGFTLNDSNGNGIYEPELGETCVKLNKPPHPKPKPKCTSGTWVDDGDGVLEAGECVTTTVAHTGLGDEAVIKPAADKSDNGLPPVWLMGLVFLPAFVGGFLGRRKLLAALAKR